MSSSVSFSFPFEPYDIQKAFMQQLYDCLETGKLGIFESPTGTVCIIYFFLFILHYITHI